MLQGKRIAVTGASGALGVVVMQAVAAAGASVAGIARTPASKAPAQLAGYAWFGDADISEASVAEATLRAVAQKLGGLDGLLNIAGAFRWARVADDGQDVWELMHKANLLTAVNASRAALPLLGTNGRVICIGAASAAKAGVGMGPYLAEHYRHACEPRRHA